MRWPSCWRPTPASRCGRSRTLNATPHPDLERKLRTDFTAMREMFFPGSPVPTFEELMETLREIDAAVSAWKIA